MSLPSHTTKPVETKDLEPRPEDTIAILRQELFFARSMAQPASVTLVLLVSIGAVFVFVSLVRYLLQAQLQPMVVPYEAVVLLGAKHNQAIERGELWRIGSHILLHGNALHLLVNAYALYVLGGVMEKLYGQRRFLLLFLLAGFGGALASYFFTAAPSVGASGAIFGVLGAAVVFGLKNQAILPARMRRSLTAGLLPWVVLNLFIGLIIPQIDNAAHVGGLVTGALVALWLGTSLRREQSQSEAKVQWFLLGLALCYMAYALLSMLSSMIRLATASRYEILEAFRLLGIVQ